MAVSVSSVNNAVSFAGIATGIDTAKIIESLTRFNSSRILTLQLQQSVILEKQSTFSDLRAKLLELQTLTGKLARSVAGAFDSRTAVSSDPDALSASASSIAAPANYTLTVQSLAATHQIASEGFASPGTNIKEGTLTVKLGNGPAVTVTIDSSNNTLQGLADAINSSDAEVQASLVNDGSATPYRLLLTAAKSGAVNTIQVTNSLTSGSGASIDPANTTVQAAADASMKIGSGAGAITVFSDSNRFDDAIAGVTVDVARADAAKPITLSIAHDTSAAGDAVQEFVDAYNAIVEFIDARDDYNDVSKEAGILLGNRDSGDLLRDLATTLTSSVPLVNSNANRVSTVGISLDDDGKLLFDRTRFNDVFDGKVPGVTANDVKRLFALTGTSSAAGVRFVLGSSKTKATPVGSPYEIDVTQAATQASITGTNDLAESIVIDGANNAFTIKVNNKTSSSMTIASGAYTRASLAAAVQALIDAVPELAGNKVVVDLSGNKLRVTSQAYGGNSQVSIGTGSAVTSGVLGFAGSESSTGLNVAGSFIVDGVTEAATGIGQILAGNSGNANTDGLQVEATLAASQLVGGAEAEITVTSGLADRLNLVLSEYLDPVTGRFETIDEQFTSQADAITESIDRQNALLEAKKLQLQQQFAAMESAVNRLNLLSQQLAVQFVLPNNNEQ